MIVHPFTYELLYAGRQAELLADAERDRTGRRARSELRAATRRDRSAVRPERIPVPTQRTPDHDRDPVRI